MKQIFNIKFEQVGQICMFRFSQLILAEWFILTVIIACAIAAPAASKYGDPDLPPVGDELEKFEQFKGKVMEMLPEPFMKTDFFLIRWLRATDLNVDEAVTMLSENLKWRKDNNISSILSEDVSGISKRIPVTADTYDKQLRPIGTTKINAWDLGSVSFNDEKMSDILRYIDHFQEKLFQLVLNARDSGKSVKTILILVDLQGFSQDKITCSACIPVLINIIDGLENHYPGFVEEIILINAPETFDQLLSMASSLFLKQTGRESIKLFLTKDDWISYLDERIDRDQRYVNFGGTKEYQQRN